MYIAKEKGVLRDWYDSRLEMIDYYHDLSRRIARMRLLGTAHWTEEDYQLAFAIQAGYLKLPSGPLYLPESYKVYGSESDHIKRGLFNVRRWVGAPEGQSFRNHQDPFPNLPKPDANLTAGDLSRTRAIGGTFGDVGNRDIVTDRMVDSYTAPR